MTDTVAINPNGPAGDTARRANLEKGFLWGLALAVALWLAMNLGLAALFAAGGDAAEWVALLLPWGGLALAALALTGLFGTRHGPLALGANRLRRHSIGWGILTVLLLIMFLASDLVEPVFDHLDKFGGIIVDFTAVHGIFWAALAALVSVALAVCGTDPLDRNRPGAVERVFVANLTAKIAAVPMAIVAIAVFTGGTFWTILYSFTNSKLLPRAQFVGLDQYERLWQTPRWLVSIENLFIYGICTLILSFIIGFLLAALLDQKIRFENTFRTIILYPFALSFIVTGLVWQWILNPDFGVQGIVRGAGWVGFTFDPLNNSSIVIFGILIAGMWQGTGLIMVLMLPGLRGIDQEIWKAARVDGIPMWKTYLFIVIPMMRPVFITTIVIIASGIVRVYDLVVAQTSGGPGISSEVPAKYVYDYMFQGQNLGQGFAASTMMLLAVAIVVIPWAYLEFGSKKHG